MPGKMIPSLNDKNKFKACFVDTIRLFTRLSLKYKNSIRLDGCLAVTIDNSEVIIVNISETTKGENLTALYPSLLRIQGRGGRVSSENAAKEPSSSSQATSSATNTSSQLSKSLPVLPGWPSIVVSYPSTASAQGDIQRLLKSTVSSGTSHLVTVPASQNVNVFPKLPQRVLLVTSPNKKSGAGIGIKSNANILSKPQYQSLLSGKIKAVTSVTQAQVSPRPSTSGTGKSKTFEMENGSGDAGNVLQTRNIPKPAITPIEIKPEPPMDASYGKSPATSSENSDLGEGNTTPRSKSRSSVGAKSMSGKKLTLSKDKENAADSQSPMRSIRTRQSGSPGHAMSLEKSKDSDNQTSSPSGTPNSRKRRQQSSKGAVETKMRKSTDAGGISENENKSVGNNAGATSENDNEGVGNKDASDEGMGETTKDNLSANCEKETEDEMVDKDCEDAEEFEDAVSNGKLNDTTEEHVDEPQDDEESSSSDDDDDDDAASTASSMTTDEEPQQELYRCSEKFALNCEKKTEKIDAISEGLKNELNSLGKDNANKDVKRAFTKAINGYLKAKKDFNNAKTKGSGDIRKLEQLLDREFEKAMEEFVRIRGVLDTLQKKARHSKVKKTFDDEKSAGKVKRLQSPQEPKTRLVRSCGECVACKRTEECAKCAFCLDKTKYGGNNTLRQKCIKKQCLQLGKFKSVKGKILEVNPKDPLNNSSS